MFVKTCFLAVLLLMPPALHRDDNLILISVASSEAVSEFKQKHRNVHKTWQLPASFPSETVMSAYRIPHVDRNKAKFTYGKPDLQLLRGFCM